MNNGLQHSLVTFRIRYFKVVFVRLSEQLIIAYFLRIVAVLGKRTSDQAFFSFADARDTVVVSKDRDFLGSHLVNGSPYRLLMVATGNITNRQLLSIFKNHLISIENAFAQAYWVELNAEGLIIHS